MEPPHAFSTEETPYRTGDVSEDYAEILAGLYRDVSTYRYRVDELHKQVEAYRQASERLFRYFEANGGVDDVIDTVASHQVVEDLKVVVGSVSEIAEAEQRIAGQLEQLYSLSREELEATGLIRRVNDAEAAVKRRIEGLAQQWADLQVMLNLRLDGQERLIGTEVKHLSEQIQHGSHLQALLPEQLFADRQGSLKHGLGIGIVAQVAIDAPERQAKIGLHVGLHLQVIEASPRLFQNLAQ